MSINENSKPKTPEISNFTRRCSLLSRYLKEKGSFGNIDLELVRKPDSHLGLPARSNLPGKQNEIQKAEQSKGEPSKSSRDELLSESDPRSSQLTIFFGGKVMVYNEFPLEKAKEIMEVAKQANKIQTQINVENKSKNMVVLPDLNEPTNSADTSDNKQQQEQNQVVERIARRASLHRFFAKRKDRAVARAPYQVNQNAGGYLRYPPKPENVAGKTLELGQSSQRPDKAIDHTMAKPESDCDKDIAMETEEGQSYKDLDLRL